MPVGMQGLLLLVAGIIVLFAVVMVLALRSSGRSQARSFDSTTAASVWSEFGRRGAPPPELLYGTWKLSLFEVTLAVKDAGDRVVGVITQRGLSTSIAVGSMTFRIDPLMRWREAADLVADTAGPAQVLCNFAMGAHRLATYTCEDGRKLTIPFSRDWPWRRHVSKILCTGEEAGAIWTPGSLWRNGGRALVLPSEIPLAVRLFVLWKGSGLNTRTAATR